MARMIPEIPADFHGSLGEERIFRALRALPDDLVVIHSLRWIGSGVSNPNVDRPQGEGDFVFIHPKLGVIVFEVKGGDIRCDEGQWIQTNRHSGFQVEIYPEEQASRTKFRILEALKRKAPHFGRIMVCHAVWFPDAEIDDRSKLPMNYHTEMTLDSSHLVKPDEAIERAFSFWRQEIPNTKPPGVNATKIKDILCPTFSIVRSVRQTMDEREEAMIQLTMEQARVVEFLDDQNEAAIVGPAGTGKTLLAVEKSRRLAKPTEPVLFLCFNSALKDHLAKKHKQPNVSYRNFHGFARDIAGPHGSLDSAVKTLLEYLCNGIDLPYTHLVIDEAQDFEKDWLDLLRMHFIGKGAFYVFYDAKQAIQNQGDTSWLADIPCRLTLTRNCRNTAPISKFAYKAAGITSKTTKLGLDGDKPVIYPVENETAAAELLNRLLDSSIIQEKVPPHEIAVLTLKTLEDSWFADKITCSKTAETPTENCVTFNTTRRFKGLEAKKVIVVDVDFEQASEAEWRKLLYVACSRARHVVEVITTTKENQLKTAIESFGGSEKRKIRWKTISRLLNVNVKTGEK